MSSLFFGSILFQLFQTKFSNIRKLGNDIEIESSDEETPFLENLLSKHPYHPSPLVLFDYHGQLQTILQFKFRNLAYLFSTMLNVPETVKYERELFQLPDGGTIGLDWAYFEKKSEKNFNQNQNSLVLINHGLCGSSKSEYLVFLVQKLLKAGYQVVVVVARGCGGLKLTTPQTFTGSNTEDFRNAVKHVKTKRPECDRIFAIGFSLGAAITLKYVGEEGKSCPLTAAIAVCPPWDANKPTSVFAHWSALLVAGLKIYRLKHDSVLSQNPKLSHQLWQTLATNSIREFDSHMISMFGYESVEDYYEDVSPTNYVHGIHTHTLAISAKDDPVCCISACPSISSKHPPSSLHTSVGPGLSVLKTPLGGHLGFPTGWFLSSESWVDEVIISWLQRFRH